MENALKKKIKVMKCACIGVCGDRKAVQFIEDLFSGEVPVFQIDLEKTEGNVQGNSALSLSEAEQKGIKMIILKQQMIIRKDLFHRLIDYCKEKNVSLYSEWGTDVLKAYFHSLENDDLFWDKWQIYKELCTHDFISFDIFDTLLVRNTLYPEDIFDLIERRAKTIGIDIPEFKRNRIQAQEMFGLCNPDIHQIYTKLRQITGMDEDTSSYLKQLEINLEKELLEVRKDMLEIYQFCIETKKEVSLITDMYIPEDILKEILAEKGIVGYHSLYVSCTRKKLKVQGLFADYTKMQRGKRYLHIGDHRIHDGICAELAGVDYILVKSGLQIGRKTFFAEAINTAETLEERILCGMILAKKFNSPFERTFPSGSVELHSNYEFGYVFCAAILSCFIIWLYEMVDERKYDEVLFASRDGFLLQKMYRSFLERKSDKLLPKGKYFYTSRKAAVMTGINNEAMINMIIEIAFGLPPKQIMQDYFGLDDDQILDFEEGQYDEILYPYVWKHQDKIMQRAEQAKKNYFKYMRDIGLQIGRKYAFVDFVSAGTTQKSLSRIIPFEMEGLYVGWNGSDEERQQNRVEALFKTSDEYFMDHYKIMETFVTSDEPSLKCIDDNGKPMFNERQRTAEEKQYVAETQSGCLDFFEKFLDILIPEKGSIHTKFVDQVFAARKNIRLCYDTPLMDLELIDDWSNKRNKVD